MAISNASRYPTESSNVGNTDHTVTTTDSGGTSYSSGSSNTTESKQYSENTSSRQTNMTPEQLAALNGLISQLLGGGTPAQAQDRAARLQEIQNVQALRGGYSKEQAFADAQGAMNQQLRASLEKLLPSIVRAAEGAGTSQNSMRALMLQEAAQQAADSAAGLGLKAAVDYGGLSGNFSQVLEKLTQVQQDPVTQALLEALGIAKGSVQNMTSSKTGESSGSSFTNSSQSTTAPQTTRTQVYDAKNDSFGGEGDSGSDILSYSPSSNYSGGSSGVSYSGSSGSGGYENTVNYGIPGSSVSALYDANGQLAIGPVDPWASQTF